MTLFNKKTKAGDSAAGPNKSAGHTAQTSAERADWIRKRLAHIEAEIPRMRNRAIPANSGWRIEQFEKEKQELEKELKQTEESPGE